MNENLRYFGLVAELTAFIIGFAYLGEWIEKKFELGRNGMLSGVIFAIVVWFIHAIFVMKTIEKNEKKKENEPT